MTRADAQSNRLVQILIVEDVEALRMLLRLSVEKRGALVREAEGLQAARSSLREGYQPDIVLLDLELGDGLGLDLIRELPASASVHVLSADTTEETRLRCTQAGCAGVVDKTQDLSRFVDTLFAEQPRPISASQLESDAQMDRRYLEFLAETRVKLRHALDFQDRKALRHFAHRLCGTAVHFGYPGLDAGAQALSRILKKQDDGRIEPAVANLIQRIGEAIESFHYRQKLSMHQECEL